MKDEEGHTMTETTIAPRAPRSLLAFLREGREGNEGTPAAVTPGAKKRVWGPKRAIALVMMLLVPVIGVLGATAANAAEEDALKYSFYKIASSTTAFFSNVQEPGSDKTFNDPWAPVISDPGSAGSLLGYADPNMSSVSGWLASKLSGSSDAIGYDTLQVKAAAGDSLGYGASRYQGMVDYAYFGAALNGLGLDGTSTGLSLGFMNVVTGGLIMLLYILGGAVDFIFNSFVGLLGMLNPFKLFYVGVSAISPEFADGMVGNGSADVGPLSGLASWIGGWYQTLNSLSWTVMVPIFIGVLLFSLLMFKKMDRGGALKKLLVRVIFIGLGLPLLGTMYTGTLNAMGDTSSDGNSGSTRVVMSTYVDFENWAMNSRLAIPSGAKVAWDPQASQPTGPAQANVRNTALAINNQTHSLGLTSIVSSGSYDASWSNQIMEGKATDAATRTDTYGKTVDMLARFMGNAQVSAASFETRVKGDLTQSSYYSTNADGSVKDWFESLQKDADELNSDDATPSSNPLVSVRADTGLTGTAVSGTRVLTSNTSGCTYSGTTLVMSDGEPRACNLSPLAMYNYLNTDFASTSMTMYSSSNVMSEATRSIHNAVNQVGTGTMSFLYWFNAVVLLGSFVLIGLGYAFSMVFSSIRRSFQILTAVPFATLGAVAAIAKVVVYSAALILEVIVTIFVYKLVQEFLTSLPQIIEMPFAAVLSNGASGTLASFVAFLVAGSGFSLVVTLLSITGVVLFTVMALRLRKTLVKAVEEAVTKLIEKFMDTQVGIPGGGKMAPALAGGLAAGAGAAAANRMMSGGMNRGAVGNALPGMGNASGGPSGIETAGGSSPMGPGPAGGTGGQLEIDASGAPGNGDPGSPLGASFPEGSSGGTVSDEVALGRSVESNGLSKPGEISAPQVGGDDAMSAASNSIDSSAEGYKAADVKQLDAGKDGVQAVGHAGVAVGKGFAGDAAGATESGARAVQHGGSAVAAGEEAKQKNADASRSSLDKPDQRHSQRAAQAQKVSQVGGTVANAAGTVSATSGGGAASKGAQAPKSAPAKPVQGQNGRPGTSPASRQAPAPAKQVQQSSPPRAPKAPARAPKQPARATQPQQSTPRPAQAAPRKPAPKPVRPAPKNSDGDKR